MCALEKTAQYKINASSMGRRVLVVDYWRGLAILMMIFYHFMWDLGYFKFIDFKVNREPEWIVFRSIIVSSFIVVAGISIHLHSSKEYINKSFFYRLLKLVVAAALVTIGGYITRPHAPIYMGILHFFAASTVLIAPFINRQKVAFVVGCVVVLAGVIAGNPDFSGTAYCFTGLFEPCQRTADFAPLFPWFGVLLLSYSVAPLILNGLRKIKFEYLKCSTVICWLGRNSLLIYLLHVPILFFLVKACKSLMA